MRVWYLSHMCKIIWKMDPSEIERTYNIRKQQTRFYWVCSWELMESATMLTPPSTDLRGILLSIRTQYFWRTRIWKNINTILMHGEKFYQLHTKRMTTKASFNVSWAKAIPLSLSCLCVYKQGKLWWVCSFAQGHLSLCCLTIRREPKSNQSLICWLNNCVVIFHLAIKN